VATDKFLASTSDTEQIPGGASLARDRVSHAAPATDRALGGGGAFEV